MFQGHEEQTVDNILRRTGWPGADSVGQERPRPLQHRHDSPGLNGRP
jgi:hypothetical protein